MRTPMLPIRRLSRRLTAMIAACAAIAFGVTAYGLSAANAAEPVKKAGWTHPRTITVITSTHPTAMGTQSW